MSQPINGGKVDITGELIAAFEKAARLYCTRIGVDPDVAVPQPHPVLQGVMVSKTFWEITAERMADLGLMLQSMKAASGEAPDARIEH